MAAVVFDPRVFQFGVFQTSQPSTIASVDDITLVASETNSRNRAITTRRIRNWQITRDRAAVATVAHLDVPGNQTPFATVTITGPRGVQGEAGPGAPAGGGAGEIVVKGSSADYDFAFVAPADLPVSTAQAAAIAAAVAAEATLRSSGDSSEATARAAGDAALDVRLDVLEADPTTNAAVAAAVAAEAGTRAAADTAINDTLATKTDGWVNGLIAAAVGSVTQAYSTTLTALAGLTTTAFGRSVLTWADAAALRTAVSLPTSTVAGRLARYTNTAGAQGSTAGLFEDASGNVGIGTTTPANQLEIQSAGNVFARLYSTNASGYASQIFKGTGREYRLGVGGASEVTIGVANKFYIYDASAPAVRAVIDTSGNVGIGATDPVTKLDVNGAIRTRPVTVGTLPSAALGDGMRHCVTDASATHAAGLGTVVTGGGANKVPVISFGGQWYIG